MKRGLWLWVVMIAGCGEELPPAPGSNVPTDPGGTVTGPPVPPTGLASKRASRSSSIAISDDDRLVVMVNPDDDSLSVFKTSDHNRIATIPTGDEPSSVVLHPDGKTAFVANRAAGTVVKVGGLDGLMKRANANARVIANFVKAKRRY